MSRLLDIFGNEIKVGSFVVYGKSSAWTPLAVGEVVDIKEDNIKVLGHGNSRTGTTFYHKGKIIVLPDYYKELLEEK